MDINWSDIKKKKKTYNDMQYSLSAPKLNVNWQIFIVLILMILFSILIVFIKNSTKGVHFKSRPNKQKIFSNTKLLQIPHEYLQKTKLSSIVKSKPA